MTAPMHQRSVVAEASGRWQPWNFHPWEGLQKFTVKIPVVVPVDPQAEPLKPARRRGSPGIEDSLRQSLRRARTASITCRHREGALSSPALQSHSITAALEPPPPLCQEPARFALIARRSRSRSSTRGRPAPTRTLLLCPVTYTSTWSRRRS